MRDDTRNWIATADYDIETARRMFETGRYVYVIFMCHLALEKMLKAHVAEVTQAVPAKTHNLMYLVRKAGLDVPPDMLRFIGKISNGSVPTRYPEMLWKLVDRYPREVAERYLRSTEEAIKWLKEHPMLGAASQQPPLNRRRAEAVPAESAPSKRAVLTEGIIARYREALAGLGVRVERVYLYGSYKDGTQREGSDIDLVVVSSDFERFDDLKRLEALGVAAAGILEPIEAAGFTPEEIEEGKLTSFWKHVLEEEAVPV